FLLAMFLLASIPCLAGAAEEPKEKPVVVDPQDLRTPVPDPELGLTDKYDGRQVVFTGTLQATGQDTGTKQRWYQLAIPAVQFQSSPWAKPKTQTVVVTVYFAPGERRLPARTASYTVQGTGEITVDGALVIRAARTVSVGPQKAAGSR